MSATRTKKKRPNPGRGAPEAGPEALRAQGETSAPSAPVSPGWGAPDAPPVGAGRRNALIALGVFALVQVAIPLRYYLGDDLYDERFAWRMFSAVRVQECEVDVTEVRDEVVTPLLAMTFLPAPWVGLLERSRPAVVRGFLEWRCDDPDDDAEAPDSVSVRSRCVDARGDALPPVVRSLECEHRTYDEHSEPAEVSP